MKPCARFAVVWLNSTAIKVVLLGLGAIYASALPASGCLQRIWAYPDSSVYAAVFARSRDVGQQPAQVVHSDINQRAQAAAKVEPDPNELQIPGKRLARSQIVDGRVVFSFKVTEHWRGPYQLGDDLELSVPYSDEPYQVERQWCHYIFADEDYLLVLFGDPTSGQPMAWEQFPVKSLRKDQLDTLKAFRAEARQNRRRKQ